jgi:flagellar biosynthetic protein FlhB
VSEGGEGADAEDRTEAPTPKRVEKAREDGQVPLSRDAVSLATLLCATLVGMLTLPAAGAEWLRAMRVALSVGAAGAAAGDGMAIGAEAFVVLRAGALAALPVLLAVAVAAVAATMGQTGGLVHGKALAPSWSRVDPVSGFKRLFGVKNAAEVLRALAKMALVGAVAWRHLDLDALQGALHRPAGAMLGEVAAALLHLLLAVAAALAVVAGADLAWVRWRHHRQLRMSREDLRQEMRDSEGDPHVKGRLRRLRESRSRRRMLAEVPKAAVVVTNPTHYAVALAYDQGQAAPPRVVAKGVDAMAARIREAAAEHGVPIVPSPPLARALWRLELDTEIPAEHWQAVAEIIAYVLRLRRPPARSGNTSAG